MGRSAQARAFERDIELAVSDLQSPEFEKYVANFARKVLAEHLAELPVKPHVLTIVDGRVGASEDSVKYGGIIRYEFGHAGDVVKECLDWLRTEASKVGRKYAESFFVGVLKQETRGKGKRTFQSYEAEGRKIPAAQFGAESRALSGNEQFIIGNSRPENRKIDVQLMGQEPVKFSVDDKIYDRCVMAMRGRFPGFEIKRVYTLTFTGQWILVHGPRAGKPVHSPGLVITRI